MGKNEWGDGTLQVTRDGVLLTFAGIMAQPVKRKASPRFIPFAAIAAIEVSRPKHGWGYLRLVLAGTNPAGRFKPDYDLNTIRVLKDAHHDEAAYVAHQLRGLIAGQYATVYPDLISQHTQPPAPRHPQNRASTMHTDPPIGPAYPSATAHSHASSPGPTRQIQPVQPRTDPRRPATQNVRPAQSVAQKQPVPPKQTRKERLVEEASAGGTRADIANAAARMNWTFGGKREIRSLHEHVQATETVTFMAQGTFGDNQGIVVLTSERLLFYFDGWMSQRVEDFPLDRITAVTTRNGLGSGDLIVRTGGASETIKSIVNSDLKALADRLRTEIGRPRNLPGAPPATQGTPAPNKAQGGRDALDHLRRLGELRDAGIITSDEFEAKKAELLRRI